jgi:hypothetical protein
MEEQKRGRPRMYLDAQRQAFADLVRQLGARQARECLRRSVSMKTLLAAANEFGVELKKGRRPRNVD